MKVGCVRDTRRGGGVRKEVKMVKKIEAQLMSKQENIGPRKFRERYSLVGCCTPLMPSEES